MFKHYIILSSSYSQGKRIAMHYIVTCDEDLKNIKKDIESIRSRCGDTVSISSHLVLTKSETWESVKNYDGFFECVDVINSIEEFISIIQIDRELKRVDVKKYILALYEDTDTEFTQHQIEFLVFLCYMDYYKHKQKNLCEDICYATKIENLKKSLEEYLKNASISKKEEQPILEEYSYMPAQSRILFSEDGIEKLESINHTFKTYKEYTIENLVKDKTLDKEFQIFLKYTHEERHS